MAGNGMSKSFIFLGVIAVLCASCALAARVEQLSMQEEAPASQLCRYDIEVTTGTVPDAGTDARVSLAVHGKNGNGGFDLDNLELWGAMGNNHDYFENGNTDRFEGLADCTTPSPCWMLLQHDNSGNKPGWYVKSVKVTQSAVGSSQVSHTFKVDGWLALDESPHTLAALVNDCPRSSSVAMA